MFRFLIASFNRNPTPPMGDATARHAQVRKEFERLFRDDLAQHSQTLPRRMTAEADPAHV